VSNYSTVLVFAIYLTSMVNTYVPKATVKSVSTCSPYPMSYILHVPYRTISAKALRV